MAKPALKASREFIAAKDYKKAIISAKKALEYDPRSYNAYVLLGIGYFNESEQDECEKAYRKALDIDQEAYHAWKERAYIRLIGCILSVFRGFHILSGEKERCLESLEKLLEFVEEKGSLGQILRTLEFYLPSEQFYGYLEGCIVSAEVTCIKMIKVAEDHEKERINKLMAKQRGRLGFTAEEISRNVKKEVYGESALEKIYENALNWVEEDGLRREIEVKLLNHCYEHLKMVDENEKSDKREKVLKLASGMVIVGSHDVLPWIIVLEWKDFGEIDELNIVFIRDFISLFPEHPMGLCLRGVLSLYLKSSKTFVNEGTEFKNDYISKNISCELFDDPLDAFIEATENLPNSVFCYRFLARSYLSMKEYENAAMVSQKGLKVLSNFSQEIGLLLPLAQQDLKFHLALSYVYYKSPKFHDQALELFDEILELSCNNVMALHGKAIILQEKKDFASSIDLLLKAKDMDPNNILILSEIAWCEINTKKYQDGLDKLDICIEKMNNDISLSGYNKAEICWRKGVGLYEQGIESKKSESYSFFITSLKYDPTYSHSFVNLGIFYADILKDENRSMKCFQKAFELNAGEIDAAENLVVTYAKTGEWNLVEAIAKIVLSADRIHRRYSRDLSWPQRSLGIVEMNSKRFNSAIVYFQTALKITPSDSHSWSGLGEAYAKSGKYIAALKALKKSKSLDEDNWFVQYLIGDVQKKLGFYKDASESYYSVLKHHPDEFVVTLALSENYVFWASSWKEKGFYKKSEEYAIKCLKIIEESKSSGKKNSSTLWVILSRACFLLSSFYIVDSESLISLLNILYEEHDFAGEKLVPIIDDLPLDKKDLFDTNNSRYLLLWAFLFMKRAVRVSVKNRAAHSMSWYSLGQILFLIYLQNTDADGNWIHCSIYCLKRAIKMDSKNPTFWRAFGVVNSTLNPKISQHALIKSLKLDDQNPVTWADLATLYMINEDFDLAYEAYMKSQIVDPDYWVSRIGLGFISKIMDDILDAKEQFEISFINSSQNIPIVNYLFVTSSYDYLRKTSLSELTGNLTTYVFAIQKYLEQRPTDYNVLILMSLLLEMSYDWTKSILFSSKACDILEKEYEGNENPEIIAQFLHAKSSLSRALLANKQYEMALENAQIVLNLTEGSETSSNRLSCYLVASISLFYLNRIIDALEMFQSSLMEFNEHPDIIVLLCKILWATGGQEERDIAQQQLLECISHNSNHICSLLLLGSIGIINQNVEVEATTLKYLRLLDWDERKKHDVDHNIERYLEFCAYSKGNDPIYIYLSALNIYPSSPIIWSRLALLENSYDVSLMALQITLRNPCSPEILASAYNQMLTIFDCLKALHLAPWLSKHWRTLEKLII
ncbi:hypothetical protein T552_04059 [Pneumocystis carinii B80]|uniref:Superkiller protein 3 n=1 Tax=Pneumocystis carinii (strain B80) TaxID=1408658 RepID=A0A0W4ZT55_PNEC8|nr:hypothetical protein T552_04059 [Pneumocystis carinii B80]KTW31561.1 hypothetical protein T552_04059 [Pneumocystis carinii B80]